MHIHFLVMSFELWDLFQPNRPHQVSQRGRFSRLAENRQSSSVLSKCQTSEHSIFIWYSIPQCWDKNAKEFRALLKRGQCHLPPYMHDFLGTPECFVCVHVFLIFVHISAFFVCVCLFLRKRRLGQVSYPLLFCVSIIKRKFGITHHTRDHHHICEDKQQILESFTDLCFSSAVVWCKLFVLYLAPCSTLYKICSCFYIVWHVPENV